MTPQFNYDYDIVLNNKSCPEIVSKMQSMTFSSSINSLYPVAELVVYLDSSYLEEGDISVGSPMDIIIKVTDTKKYFLKYRILKINFISPESVKSMGGLYTLSLIHPWYFDQVAISKAYYGTTTGVLSSIILEENHKTFEHISLDTSIDIINKHFRTYQTQGAFIEERIADKYLVDNSPSFIYVNNKNEFHAHSFLNMLKTPTNNFALDTRRVVETTPSLKKSIFSDRLVYALGMNYYLNSSGTLWNKAFARFVFLFTTHTSKKPKGISDKDCSFFSDSGFYPIHNSLMQKNKPLVVYTDDSEGNTSNIYYSMIEKQKDLLSNNSFTVYIAPNFTIEIGENLTLSLRKSEDDDLLTNENSLFYATYVISSISLVFQKRKFMMAITLICDAIKPSTPTALKNVKGILSL